MSERRGDDGEERRGEKMMERRGDDGEEMRERR